MAALTFHPHIRFELVQLAVISVLGSVDTTADAEFVHHPILGNWSDVIAGSIADDIALKMPEKTRAAFLDYFVNLNWR